MNEITNYFKRQKRYNRKSKEENKEFWLPLITNKKGDLSKQKILLELSDYKKLLNNIPVIFDRITGGMLTDPFRLPVDVCERVDDYFKKSYDIVMKDFLELMYDKKFITKKQKQLLLNQWKQNT